MIVYPTRSTDRCGCIFVTVFWGDWHRDVFLNLNLPTMLAPGNLPALAAGIDCEYLIYTTSSDASRMEQSGSFQRLRALLPVSIELFTPSRTRNPIMLHHEIWRGATERARRRRALVLLMAPDVAWADGSFARLRAAIEGGKRAIFMAYPRVNSETILPAIGDHFPRRSDQAIAIPARDMMALTLNHLHPLMAAYTRSSRQFPIHPEMVLWPVKGDGFLLRLLARELFCFEPGRYRLNAQSLLARLPPIDEIHVFDDSREFLGVSLTPLLMDLDWYRRPNGLDPLAVGPWWIYYDSPLNDHISSIDLRFTCGTGDERHWRRTQQQARSLLSHLRHAREFTRISQTLRLMGHWHAAEFVSAALCSYGLARRWPHRGPFLVLAPTDMAIERAGFAPARGKAMSAKQLRQVIEAHVAVLPEPHLLTDGLQLTTLAGRHFRLKNRAAALDCGANLVVPIEIILHE